MSVRKRQWTTSKGEPRESWVVNYTDPQGKRRLKTFKRKKQADSYAAGVTVEVERGTHIPDRESMTVADAGELWLAAAKAEGLERVSIVSYRQQFDLHIKPFLGTLRLTRLSAPVVRSFEDKLKDAGRSAALIRRVRRTLGTLVADAQERGNIATNPVFELRAKRQKRKKGTKGERGGKLKVGIDIPTPPEVAAILKQAKGRWHPLLMTVALTGLRASEARGLRWIDLDLDARVLHVRQRADRFNEIGPPKSEAGERTLPLSASLTAELKEWRKVCPKGKLGLVFPNGAGHIENHSNIVTRGLKPIEVAAGVTVPVLDAEGKPRLDAEGVPMVKAKYPGLHSLRHFFASWCINRLADGGLELSPKQVQERMGHATFALTMDTYGHLFPRGHGHAELDAAERALLLGAT